MSRHQFPGKAGATSVVIGWDRPLRTFFVQMFAPDPDTDGEGVPIVWEGCTAAELPEAADAIRIAHPYADLPDDLRAILEIDRLRTIASTDGPAQIAARKFLRDRGS